jgi:hypothetical protein
VHQTLRDAGSNPAAAFHIEAATGLQRTLRELFFELRRGNGPFSRQAIDDEILEPHGDARKAAEYTWRWTEREQAMSD